MLGEGETKKIEEKSKLKERKETGKKPKKRKFQQDRRAERREKNE